MRTTAIGCVVVAAGLLLACSSWGSPSQDDPNCHWDCFGYETCQGGVVTTWGHTPVPCDYWQGECPHSVSYECERGCRTDIDQGYQRGIEPRDLCEEHRPKQVGDPGADESHCRPEVATWDHEGTVTNVYLTCDASSGQCVSRDPPVVPDWLAPCGLGPESIGSGYAGVVETNACAGGVCLFVQGVTCVAQGCTTACESDGECPPGSVCEPEWQVCKPGPPGVEGVDLTMAQVACVGTGRSCPMGWGEEPVIWKAAASTVFRSSRRT